MLQFELDDFFWVSKTRIPAWAGFQERLGAYGGKSSDAASDGTVSVTFAPDGRGTEPLNAQEIGLIDWFEKNKDAQAKTVIAAILSHYPDLQSSYKDAYGNEDVSDILPGIKSVYELQNLIGLYNINIHALAKDDIPYIGYEFGCEWDSEHGLGVLVHGSRVVKIGYLDIAILLWVAEDDASKK